VLIEGNGILVFGIDDQGECGNVRLDYPTGGVHQHRGAEPSAPEILVNRQATDAHGGDGRLRWKLACDLDRKVRHGDVTGRERVEAADLLGVAAERDVARRQAAADVLGDLAVEISVERLDPATERAARPFPQRLGTQGSECQAGPTMRL